MNKEKSRVIFNNILFGLIGGIIVGILELTLIRKVDPSLIFGIRIIILIFAIAITALLVKILFEKVVPENQNISHKWLAWKLGILAIINSAILSMSVYETEAFIKMFIGTIIIWLGVAYSIKFFILKKSTQSKNS